MANVRDILNQRPWIAWVIAAAAIGTAVVMATGTFSGQDPVEYRSEDVTIRCTETGKEWTMNRGLLIRELMSMPGPIDPEKGIPSPYADGRLTGVIVDKSDWEKTVKGVNELKAKHSGD